MFNFKERIVVSMEVLLVSNNDRFLKLVNALLVKENVEVYCLNSDTSYELMESLFMFNNFNFSHFLIDSTVKNALALCEKIKSKNNNTNIILFTKPGQSTEEIIDFYKIGVQSILEKPFFPAQLFALMELELNATKVRQRELKEERRVVTV